MALMSAWELMAVVLAADTFLVLAVARAIETLPVRANFFFGLTFDLENFPTSGVKGRVLLEATHPVGHLLLQLRSSTFESHKATTRTALLNG